MNAYYPEALAVSYDPEQEAGHEALVGGTMSELDPEGRVEAILSLYPDLRYLNGCIQGDPELKEALRKVTEQLINFSRESDLALDLAGRNNLFLAKTNTGWKLKMPDPLPPGEVRFSDLEEAVKSVGSDKPVSIKWDRAMNALNTVRVLNALALISGSSERLYVPGLDGLSADFFLERFRQFFPVVEN